MIGGIQAYSRAMKESPIVPWKKALPNLARDTDISTRMPGSLKKRAHTYAIDHGTRLQEVVIAALDEYLKNNKA